MLNLDANIKFILFVFMLFSKHRLRAVNEEYQATFCSEMKLRHITVDTYAPENLQAKIKTSTHFLYNS